MKLKTFIENHKKQLIITGIIFFIVGFIGAIVYSYCVGIVKTVALIIGLLFLIGSIIILCGVYYLGKKEGKKDRNKYKNEAKNIPRVKGQNQRKEIVKFGLISLLIVIISGVLLVGGLCMIIFANISAVRIAGIIIVSVSGFVLFIIGVIYYFFIY